MGYFDSTLSGAGSGALSGAAVDAMTGGATLGAGTAIGAGLGALTGFFRGNAQNKQKKALGQARLQMEQLARDQRAQRQADLQKAIGFFDPVRAEITRLYGG